MGTFDGKAARLYVDGELAAGDDLLRPDDLLMMPEADVITLGGGRESGGTIADGTPGYVGDMDEVAIYSTALLPAVISEHYRVGRMLWRQSAPTAIDLDGDGDGDIAMLGGSFTMKPPAMVVATTLPGTVAVMVPSISFL